MLQHSWVQPGIKTRAVDMRNEAVAFVQQSVATLLWEMYCIKKHIYYCTFVGGGGGSLKGEYHSTYHNITSLIAATKKHIYIYIYKICIYELVFQKFKTVRRKKGRLALKLEETFFVPRASSLWRRWWIPRRKMSPDPRENKTLSTEPSFFFQLGVTSQSKEQGKLLRLVSGRKRGEQ